MSNHIIVISTITDVCSYTRDQISTIPDHADDSVTSNLEEYNEAVAGLDLKSVFKDLYALLTDSQDC